MVIWKFNLTGPITKFEVPQGSRVLSTAFQGKIIVVWVEVPLEDEPLIKITIQAIDTGKRVDNHPRQFIGTVTSDTGIVWHIYRRFE